MLEWEIVGFVSKIQTQSNKLQTTLTVLYWKTTVFRLYLESLF